MLKNLCLVLLRRCASVGRLLMISAGSSGKTAKIGRSAQNCKIISVGNSGKTATFYEKEEDLGVKTDFRVFFFFSAKYKIQSTIATLVVLKKKL